METPRIHRSPTMPALPEVPGQAPDGVIRLPELKEAAGLVAAHMSARSAVAVQPGPNKSLARPIKDAFARITSGFQSLKTRISSAYAGHVQKQQRRLSDKAAVAMREIRDMKPKGNEIDTPALFQKRKGVAGAAFAKHVRSMSNDTIETLAQKVVEELTAPLPEEATDMTRAAAILPQLEMIEAGKQSFYAEPSKKLKMLAGSVEGKLLKGLMEQLPQNVKKEFDDAKDKDAGTFFRGTTERSATVKTVTRATLTSNQKAQWLADVLGIAVLPEGAELPAMVSGKIYKDDVLSETQKTALDNCVKNAYAWLMKAIETMPQEWKTLALAQDKALQNEGATDQQRATAALDAVVLRAINPLLQEMRHDPSLTTEQKAVVAYINAELQKIANGLNPQYESSVAELAKRVLQSA